MLVVATLGGLWPSLLACLASTIAFNVLFIPPLYSLTIADPENVVALFFFAVVAVVASITLDRGLDRLFSTRTKQVIENSMMVADAYLQERAQIVRGDILAMAFDVSRAKPLFDQVEDMTEYLDKLNEGSGESEA